MSIRLTLLTCHIGDVVKPQPASDDYEEEVSPYDAASMTEAEKQAVQTLLQAAWAHHSENGKSRFRLETLAEPVTIRATGLHSSPTFPHFKVSLRSLAAEGVEFLFMLMRAGNLFLIPDFDQRSPVTVSAEQKQHIAGHMPAAQVCSTPEELQRYLSKKVEAHQQARPDWFKDNWEDPMDDAEAAGRLMQRDRRAGEREFQRLLADHHPGTGSLYLVRGRAYETLGLKELAANDYRRALELLPEGDLFRDGALRALARVAQ
jgi:hypothetical protein